METVIILIASLLLLIGVIGSIVPIIPGPPISFLAILLLHFFGGFKFDFIHLITIFFFVMLITIVDYWLQVYGVKRFGGGKKATNGTIIGLILGLFIFPPIGVFLGPFLGAFFGAKLDGGGDPFKIAFGSLLGFLGGTILKIIISCFIIYFAVNTFLQL